MDVILQVSLGKFLDEFKRIGSCENDGLIGAEYLKLTKSTHLDVLGKADQSLPRVLREHTEAQLDVLAGGGAG